MNELNVCYVWSDNLLEQCDRLPAVVGRASMVHSLISSYGLLEKLTVIKSLPATYSELIQFHSELYLDHLKQYKDIDEDYMPSAQDEDYGIGYDCTPVSNMFELVSTVAGGTITAAKTLLLGVGNVVINWCGGWHHAHRFGAEGFCYINDIVLAIEKLRLKFPKILYIDLDIHHGNGVEDAFNLSNSVFTLSFHKYEPGFYPGTGGIDDIGSMGGKGYSCNIPLHASYSDKSLEYCFDRVFTDVYTNFAPDAIVVQCGADALAYDPHGGANLTERSYCKCVQSVLHKQKPTLLLGGGGYKHTNAARLWTSLTAMATDVTLDENIPEHTYWPKYGPSYTLHVEPSLARDLNKISYLDDCITKISENMKLYLKNIHEEAQKRKKIEVVSSCGLNLMKKHCTRKEMQNNKEDKTSDSGRAIDVYTFDED